MYFKLCFCIANATNVFLSSILDILRERGIPHQISPSTYHPWCYSVVSPVLRSSRLSRYEDELLDKIYLLLSMIGKRFSSHILEIVHLLMTLRD